MDNTLAQIKATIGSSHSISSWLRFLEAGEEFIGLLNTDCNVSLRICCGLFLEHPQQIFEWILRETFDCFLDFTFIRASL